MATPTTVELVEAVRERMESVADRPIGSFEARVISNVLAIVERELEHGAGVEAADAADLASLGVASEPALVSAIRAGRLADREREVCLLLRSGAARRLAIDNPRWLR